MQKFTLLLILLTIILTACSGASPQVSETEEIPRTGPENTPVMTVEPFIDATQEVDAVTPEEADTSGVIVTGDQATDDRVTGDRVTGDLITYILVEDETSITYEVGETFIDRGNVFNVAIGTTQGVNGEIELNLDRPQETRVSTLTVDISGFRSDNQRRDNAIRDRFLQSSQFPTVTFTPTEISGLPEAGEPGVEYPLSLQGDLTIRDVTRPATFDAVVSWQADELRGQAVTTFLMSEFGFGPIEIFGILATEDEVKVTVDFIGRPE